MTSFRQILAETLVDTQETVPRPIETSFGAFAAMSDLREEPALVAPPSWALELEVEFPYDAPAIRRAFRRMSLKTHPDCTGGSHTAFLRAQRLLEEALRGLSRGAQSAGRASFCSNSSGNPSASVYA